MFRRKRLSGAERSTRAGELGKHKTLSKKYAKKKNSGASRTQTDLNRMQEFSRNRPSF